KQPVTVIYNKNSGKFISGILGMHSNGGEVSLEGFAFTSVNRYLTEDNNQIIGYIDSYLLPNKEEKNPILVFFKIPQIRDLEY
ncbi:MAG TPA: hypothetical protein VKA38_15095, partial [Draconibacterium sp.]|nr:hypothetical protein [Draconibacterium sp.]